MAADLTFSGFKGRRSLVLLDDHLVELQHATTRDRVRRIHFDRIESVLVWRTIPVLRLLVVLALVALPGALLIAAAPDGRIPGIIVLAIAALLAGRYLYARRTTIRIVRAGSLHEYTGIIRPGKISRFMARLEAAIRRAQEPAQVGGPN